ncbi:capsular polysaccharide biosynthesis protein [Shewanella sp. JM162201]|uniref:Capsular polysaccharide biosynthesis protein n=1 Tax=Shewanella jiangmenensis TaxID=2837387 RepID=A0ABS5V4G3_9GAMM|nr:capsular polysaccharide biosynthesis protein [Shewanella jiangmenensis]MBT1445359.1 capsular polysaccharide biosynthesis protein [Shewanella jiangmenensis]
MTLYTNSAGIWRRRLTLQKCLNVSLARFSRWHTPKAGDVYVGWGNKPASRRMAEIAARRGVPFARLEDGFIGYSGHPASGGTSVAIIKDDVGIYYDSNQPSQLELLIPVSLSEAELARSRRLQAQIVEFGITKYNCYPSTSAHRHCPEELTTLLNGSAYVLLVDQVAGDQSLIGGQVGSDDALAMVSRAKACFPDARLVIRAHPDTLQGNKSSLLSSLRDHELLKDAVWFAAPCHPHGIIAAAEAVFTLTSQLGFEALLLGKPVFCFGMPFYAGWGLTQDSKSCPRRREAAPEGILIEQLLHAALVRYPKYFHPVLNRACEVEEAIELIRAQQLGLPSYNTLYLLGFSLWKQAFIGDFCRHLACRVRFVSRPPGSVERDDKLLVWGNRFPELEQVLRIEDGFIRSAGLGSNLCRPSSVVIDDESMYFNAQRPNRLRRLLNDYCLTPEDLRRGALLVQQLVSADINKYNLSGRAAYVAGNHERQRVLVVGQVDGDASTLTGSPVIKSNEELLWAVRKDNPDAWVIYKPHPDVVAGNREGKLTPECVAACVDEYVTDVTLADLYPHIDELHTMTSLSGFEALLRGVSVVTWGQPFYAGWGLTADRYPASDRLRPLSLEALVFITLVKYPIYIDWGSGLYARPEWMIEKFAGQKASAVQQQSRWNRWQLKLGYLLEALRKR